MKNKKNYTILIILLLLLAVLVGWIVWDNNRITVTEYTIKDNEIPESFSGYRIVQISDLHNAEFGSENELLLNNIRLLQPDIIVLTGDLIDSYHTDVDISLAFVRQAVQIAPTYYVFGNHEVRIPDAYRRLKAGMEDAGVVILDESILLKRDSEVLALVGVPDPSALGVDSQAYTKAIDSLLEERKSDRSTYSVLLCHRPEVFDAFVENGVDLVFTGHTHGGQIRLPLIGAVFAPDQGLFPVYDAGIFTKEDTTMIISRGLGNSSFPFRVDCPPEIVVATLMHE